MYMHRIKEYLLLIQCIVFSQVVISLSAETRLDKSSLVSAETDLYVCCLNE